MKYKIGSIMALVLDDHVEDGNAPISITVYGRIAKHDKLSVSIDSWEYSDTSVPYDSNEKRFTVLKSAIRKAKVLEVKA